MKKPKLTFLIFFLIISVVTANLLFLPSKAQAQIFQTPSAEDLRKVGRVLGAGAGLVGICLAWSRIGGGIQEKLTDLGSGFIGNLVSGAVGGAVPTEDSKNKREQKSQNCLNRMGDYFLATMKQRLLNRLTQQTVEWIQGDGTPRFLQNPTAFLTDATDAALGDIIEETSLSNLCSSELKTRILFQLEQPVFEDRVSCTITEVLGNAQGSIQAFHDDFRNGSWVAYNEILKPQNNKWGLELIVQEERFQRQEQQEEAARYEASVGDGFLSQKRCMQWQKKGSDPVNTASGRSYWTETPDINEDGEHDGVRYTGRTERPAGSEWFCIQSETVTPGSVAADALTSSLESSFNFINNADDLTTFVTAVTNALINELTMDLIEGREPGIVGAFRGDDDEENYESNDCDVFEEGTDLRERCEAIESEDGGFGNISTLQEALDEFEESLNEANDTTIVVTREENERLINMIEALKQCQNATGDVENSNVESLLSQSNERINTINSLDKDLSNLLDELSNIRNLINSIDDDQIVNIYPMVSDFMSLASDTITSVNDTHEIVENQKEIVNDDLESCSSVLNIGDSHPLTVGDNHQHNGATISNTDGNWVSFSWSLESCPDTCPPIDSNESGTINQIGEDVSIPGPIFRPNEEGSFELMLKVENEDGYFITSTIIEETQ